MNQYLLTIVDVFDLGRINPILDSGETDLIIARQKYSKLNGGFGI